MNTNTQKEIPDSKDAQGYYCIFCRTRNNAEVSDYYTSEREDNNKFGKLTVFFANTIIYI